MDNVWGCGSPVEKNRDQKDIIRDLLLFIKTKNIDFSKCITQQRQKTDKHENLKKKKDMTAPTSQHFIQDEYSI